MKEKRQGTNNNKNLGLHCVDKGCGKFDDSIFSLIQVLHNCTDHDEIIKKKYMFINTNCTEHYCAYRNIYGSFRGAEILFTFSNFLL